MRVKIIRTTVASDSFVRVGQVVDLPEAEARMLIAIHKAELVAEEAPAEPEPLSTEAAQAVIEVETKKPRGRRK